MDAHWDKKNDHTRIFYLSFGTSAGNSISGGTQPQDKKTVTAPEGYQLGGFFGRDGDEIDQLGAIWTKIESTPSTPKEENTTIADTSTSTSASLAVSFSASAGGSASSGNGKTDQDSLSDSFSGSQDLYFKDTYGSSADVFGSESTSDAASKNTVVSEEGGISSEASAASSAAASISASASGDTNGTEKPLKHLREGVASASNSADTPFQQSYS